MQLNDSTRRGLRTLYQAALTGLVTIPIVLAAIPQEIVDSNLGLAGIIASILSVLAVVSKVVNALEDSGAIPPVLKAPASKNLAITQSLDLQTQAFIDAGLRPIPGTILEAHPPKHASGLTEQAADPLAPEG